MERPLTAEKDEAIKQDIMSGTMSHMEISRNHGVSYLTVDMLYHVLKEDDLKIGKNDSQCYLTKTEPYCTEQEMLNPPVYEATNRHLIKPIREDWKLWNIHTKK